MDENTSAKHYDKVFDMYEKKIIVLDAFQNGLDINKAAFESKNNAFEQLFNINNHIAQD